MRLSGPDSRAIADSILALLRMSPAGRAGPRELADLLDGERPARRSASSSPSSKRRAPTPPKTWSRSPATARRLSCASAWSARWQHGARLAEPGEFTLRAYLNGRIDLPQAEAVRDLIDATTLYQARVAAQQMEGSVSRRIRPDQRSSCSN